MSAPRFTPGPWFVGDFYATEPDDPTAPAMAVWSHKETPAPRVPSDAVCLVTPLDRVSEVDIANATLIAAAPELFEALHRLICSVQDQGHEWAELKAARAALAKAAP